MKKKLFEDYIYEVRGCNDPIDGDIVKFETKVEALQYADMCPNCTVYMVEVAEDDNTGCLEPTGEEIQIRGPEVERAIKDDSCTSCEESFCKEDLGQGIKATISNIMNSWDTDLEEAYPIYQAVYKPEAEPNQFGKTAYRGKIKRVGDQIAMDDYDNNGELKSDAFKYDTPKKRASGIQQTYYDGAPQFNSTTINGVAHEYGDKRAISTPEIDPEKLKDMETDALARYQAEHPEYARKPKEERNLFNYDDDMTDEALATELYKRTKCDEDLSADEVRTSIIDMVDSWSDDDVDNYEEGYDDRRGHDPVDRRERVAEDADYQGLVEALMEATDEVEYNVDGTIVGEDPEHDAFLNGKNK